MQKCPTIHFELSRRAGYVAPNFSILRAAAIVKPADHALSGLGAYRFSLVDFWLRESLRFSLLRQRARSLVPPTRGEGSALGQMPALPIVAGIAAKKDATF